MMAIDRPLQGVLQVAEQVPAVGDLNYRSIRGAEKILEPGEDWRILGTNDDPIVQEAYEAVSAPDGGLRHCT